MRVLIVILLFSNISFGQYWYKSDTTCYSLQYIAVDIDEFSLVPSPIQDSAISFEKDTSDFFDFIHQLNKEHLLPIFEWDVSPAPYYLQEKDLDSLLESDPQMHTIEHPELEHFTYFYRFCSNHDIVIYDEYGFPMIDNAGNELTYPNDTIDFHFLQLYELRIIEYYDYINQDSTPRVTQIGFVALDTYEDYVELFWINFADLREAIEIKGIDPEDLFWYKKLAERTYSGFRYKQDPCDRIISR